jgi:hypothetical protein
MLNIIIIHKANAKSSEGQHEITPPPTKAKVGSGAVADLEGGGGPPPSPLVKLKVCDFFLPFRGMGPLFGVPPPFEIFGPATEVLINTIGVGSLPLGKHECWLAVDSKQASLSDCIEDYI